MKQENKYAMKMVLLVVSIALVSSLIPYAILAQTQTTQKLFFLGTSPVGVLDDFLYPSGDQISYDISGYPPITIIIHKWNELGAVQKTQITVRLQTMGYIEGQEETPQSLFK